MNLRRRLVVTALAAPALLAGCKVRTINYFPVVAARVRFANLMLDSGALDVFEGEAEVWSAIGFEGTTGFLEFDNNEKTFAVRVPDATTDLAATKLTLAGEQPYTLVAYGTLPSPQVFLAPDPTTAIGSGNFQIRLIDVSSGSTTVDIYITKPDVAIDDEVGPNFIGITSGSATVSLRFAAETLRIRMTPNGSKLVFYDSGAFAFQPDVSYDFLLYSIGSAGLPQGMLLEVNATEAKLPLANTLGGVKLVNGAIDSGETNAFLGDAIVMGNVEYPGYSVYAALAVGTQSFRFESENAAGTTIATLQHAPVSAMDSSILLVGFPGAVQAVAVADDNRITGPGETRVRVVNGVSDTASFDVYVGDTRLAQALAPRAASAYSTIVPVSATVTFRDPGSGTTLLTVDAVPLGEGRTTTVYAVGSAGALKSIVSLDR